MKNETKIEPAAIQSSCQPFCVFVSVFVHIENSFTLSSWYSEYSTEHTVESFQWDYFWLKKGVTIKTVVLSALSKINITLFMERHAAVEFFNAI